MSRSLLLATLFASLVVGGAIYAPVSANSQQEIQLYNNGNIYTVFNNPTAPTRFVLRQAVVITYINTYHWNNARGSRPGTITLRSSTGQTFGPWQAVGSPGQGGVPNAYWIVKPNARVPAGEYTVVDSEPSTWAQNTGTRGAGMTTIKGFFSAGPQPTPTPPAPVSTSSTGNKIVAVTENRTKTNQLIWPAGNEPKSPMDVLNYHLEPGWKGTLNVAMPIDGRIRFVGGTGGQGSGSQYDKITASCTWTGDPKDLKKFPYIIFEANGTLTCATGQKP